ncbi:MULTISPECIES: nitroreductase family protein [unclassified Caulobacter]|uniref:nitroreductase family protein n=1 Tax=unclassified Caulobacter TaxID=2648921 RepID=UPI0009EB14C4|nr:MULTISPECIES: nitroreductase [unclassified Caulobacter]
MDVLEAIHARRAVRDYRQEPVADSVLAALIDAAIWAPSGINLQPWCFFVIDDAATLASCSTRAKAALQDAATDHPELAGLRPMLASPSFNIFYNAPALIIICATTADEMALKDCCLAAQNLMLAATAKGLGSCWIGLSETWLNTDQAKADLGIPGDFKPVAPIIVGYPNRAPAASSRREADIRHVGRAAWS